MTDYRIEDLPERLRLRPKSDRRTGAKRGEPRILEDESGCWIWQGYVGAGGYPRVGWQGSLDYAHRVSYRIAVGEIPAGCQITHLCGNHSCIRPDHMRAMSMAEREATEASRQHRRRAGLRRRKPEHRHLPEGITVSSTGWAVLVHVPTRLRHLISEMDRQQGRVRLSWSAGLLYGPVRHSIEEALLDRDDAWRLIEGLRAREEGV